MLAPLRVDAFLSSPPAVADGQTLGPASSVEAVVRTPASSRGSHIFRVHR